MNDQKSATKPNSGAALVLVLSFVVLLTVVVVAFFSRATVERSVSSSSANSKRAETLAISGLNIVVANLKQEIVQGSTPSGSPPVYLPASPANMIPQRHGTPAPALTPIPNLIRISIRGDGPGGTNLIPSPGIPSLASAVGSLETSLNGRSVSLPSWNSHYLIPRLLTPVTIDSTPVTSFTPPDWVLVTRNGPTVEPDIGTGTTAINNSDGANGNFVIGRYAFAIYDEGGLLDVNVAGYPSPTPSPVPTDYVSKLGRKGSLAYANLGAVPTSTATPAATMGPLQANNVVGWRNYASISTQSNAPPTGDLVNSYSFNATNANDYYNFIQSRTDGYMSVSPQPYPSPIISSSRTDQAFSTRQDLLRFRRLTSMSQNALAGLGTFSRELDIPSWSPASPTATNPDFRILKVTAQFTRYDGTTATVGDPLVNHRFLLSRLNWLTYLGPSATRTIPPPSPTPLPSDANYDMWALVNLYRLDGAFLQQGIDLSQPGATGQTANIYKYFGLYWDAGNERWNYIGHPSNPSTSSPLATSIATLSTITGEREPDFFELLQAGILDGSLGDSLSSAFPIVHQQSKMLQLLTIGANLISQATVDSYPVRIACSVGGVTMEAVGTERLPYVNMLGACAVGSSLTTGGVSWFLIPNLWDPYRNTADMTTMPLRPVIRVNMNGTASFAAVTSPSPSPIPSPTPVSTSVTTGPTGLGAQLVSVTASGGRDGLVESARLSLADLPPAAVTPTPAAFNAYPFTSESSNSTVSIGWRKTNAVSGSSQYVVMRANHPGSAILPAIYGMFPALILNSGFRVTMDYQSPTTSSKWYSYSYLQGNNDSTTAMPQVIFTDPNSVYASVTVTPTPTATPYATNTIARTSTPTQITPWAMSTLNVDPVVVKSDPRSIRFNSVIGVLSDPSPSPTPIAAVVNSIWPNGSAPQNFASGTPNPAWYAQNKNSGGTFYPDADGQLRLGDNAASNSNPYRVTGTQTDPFGDPVRPLIVNRPFQDVAEMGYAFRDQPFKSLDFSTANSADAGILDLFCVHDNTNPSHLRAGVVNLNSQYGLNLAAVLAGTLQRDDSYSSTVTATNAGTIGVNLSLFTNSAPLTNRAGLVTAVSNDATIPLIKTQHEAIIRGWADTGQTRTWNLMIDLIAQSGRYPPTAGALKDFVVEGEKRYWLHIAIDRFTGEVVDQQLEAVEE